MTLIIAADVQDHLILAGDHCAVMSRVSIESDSDVVIGNYRKVFPWKYGAVTASGDVFLVMWFCRLFLHHEQQGGAVDLLQVASEAKHMRTRHGIPRTSSTANIFFSLPGADGFALHGLSIKGRTMDYERIEPISTRFSMREERSPDESVCQAFNTLLRPSFFFQTVDAFNRHHLDLLGAFYTAQSAVDDRVTATFDVFMLDKTTGEGTFWHGSHSPGRLTRLNDVG